MTSSLIRILTEEKLPPVSDISNADIIVVAGSGVRTGTALNQVKELAETLGGVVACSRPMVERGLFPVTQQIGLSGRTVKPKLIITCGVSGAIQFTSGMNKSETIISINTDENAPINSIAHYAIIGDLNEILPQLLKLIKGE
ncbi:MAG: electron transfer flavoprotein subunit alpha/FixB family protein, partial [Erysipelotrichaceae bacterium]|nr:electron transfer flavoprotein subunit alpha/FixB family protein [Erysipelotrichaceae bacterium]